MRLTLGELRTMIGEATIAASPSYMKKERIREQLQQFIASKVTSGEVVDQESLDSLVSDMHTSLTALKMIPFDVWRRLSVKG